MRNLVKFSIILFCCPLVSTIAQTEAFNAFTFTPPNGWKKDLKEERVMYEGISNGKFCQIYLWTLVNSSGNNQADFDKEWNNLYAKNYTFNQKPQIEKRNEEGWEITVGVAPTTFKGGDFMAMLVTFTGKGQSFSISSNFNDESFLTDIEAFMTSLDIKEMPAAQTNTINSGSNKAANSGISISTTNFDDGWISTPKTDYVQVSKADTEVRLYYIDKPLDDAKTQYDEPTDYFWKIYVAPEFKINNPQKFSGVTYPIIYHQQADAIEIKTGKRCYIAMKVIYEGGARVIIAITPTQNIYQQLFPQPDAMNRMIGYNKFAVAAKDIFGSWSKSGGSGVEYYNAYSGNYAGMSAISTTDEFIFSSNSAYQSIHNSASTGSSGTKFAALKYNGKFTVNNWELMATNRVEGKTKKFWCQFEAVKGGFLLILTDSDYEPLKYVLFKKK
ncbi:MAG: hypothetical protein H7Y04_11185 [Verrucomicrobia bacterium]|nr:hypothetical protein [Cytophagales bacterium]